MFFWRGFVKFEGSDGSLHSMLRKVVWVWDCCGVHDGFIPDNRTRTLRASAHTSVQATFQEMGAVRWQP